MNIDLESLKELNSLGLLAERPAAAALLQELQSAAGDRETLLAEREAKREAQRARETPIAFTLPTIPESADDLAIIQMDRRPILGHAIVDGQTFAQKLARGPVCFISPRFIAALDRGQSPSGWLWCSIARVAALDELIGPRDFSTVVDAGTSETIPVLIACYRRLASRSGTQAKSLATLVANKLSELSHSMSGLVQGSARAEHAAEESATDRILALAGPVAAPSLIDDDPDLARRTDTNDQANRLLAKQIEKANRDSARAAVLEAEEDARFAEKVKAASA